MAVGLFTTVPVELYKLSVSLQGIFTAGITGFGTDFETVASNIINTLKGAGSVEQAMSSNVFGGLTAITILRHENEALKEADLCIFIPIT